MVKSRKTVGVLVRGKNTAELARETLRGAKGVTVRLMTRESYQKASDAANSALRSSVAKTS